LHYQMTEPFTFASLLAQFADILLVWGWLFILFLALWIAWETYMLIKHIDYIGAIKWTYLQITVPDDAGQTPKAMENAFEVWGGIHKDPDLIEKYLEGYFLAWFSCEIQCSKGQVRYVMVVPTVHAKFFEGVLYGQYPTAEIVETDDYTQMFNVQDIDKTFDLYGADIVLVKDDYYPIRTYIEYEDRLAEDDRFVDPHQALVEAFSTVGEGEHFWVQVLVKPVSGSVIQKWADKGQEKIKELSGEVVEKPEGIWAGLAKALGALPKETVQAATVGPLEPVDAADEGPQLRFYNPAQDAEMRGILQKVSRTGFKTRIRVMHFAPAGKLHKPNIGKAIGAFKQFNSFNLNSLKPEPSTKTNGPNYILKQTRRRFRKRVMLFNFQWRDFWGDDSGEMFTAEELATLYHLPIKYVRSPAVERGTSGLGAPPENLPYAS